MPYSSLRDFIARLEAAGRLVRVAAPVSPDLEMTEIQTRLLAEGGPAVLFENVVRSAAASHAGAGQSVRHRRARRLGHGPRAGAVARDRRDAGLPEAAGAARRLARGARAAAAAEDRHGDEAAHGRFGAVPGNRAARRRIDLGRCRSRPAGRASRRRSSPGRWSSPRVRARAARTPSISASTACR